MLYCATKARIRQGLLNVQGRLSSQAGKPFLIGAVAASLVFAAWSLLAQRKPESSGMPPKPRHLSIPRSTADAALQRSRNVGKAYYEQGKYAEAIVEFQKVLASGQALATDHLDLGLALIQTNNLDAAFGELTTAKQMDAHLLAADYNLGILYKRQLRYPQAEAEFQRVVELDPSDPAAWFNQGTVYFAERKLEAALDAHQHVVQMGFARGQNFYVASLFHTFTILTRLKRAEEAQRVLRVHEQMRDKVPNISLQVPALEGGRYGAVLIPTAPATPSPRMPPARIVLADVTGKLGVTLPARPFRPPPPPRPRSEYSLEFATHNLVPLLGPSIAVGDYDGDGRPDLYVANPAGKNTFLHNNGDGSFSDVTRQLGVEGPGGTVSAAFADYDNSSHPSLFLAGVGGVRLYRNRGDGKFSDETEKAGLKSTPGELATRAVLFDADNDGFLDLLVTIYTDLNTPPRKDHFVFPGDFEGGRVVFYRNNGDGTFTEGTSQAGLMDVRGRWCAAAFGDFDNDGYADLVLLRDDGPPTLFLNRGEGKFADRTAQAGPALSQSPAFDGQVADFNHDGNFDLCLWSRAGAQVLLNRGNAQFEAMSGLPRIAPPSAPFAFRGTVADMDGDGFSDLIAADADGKLHLLTNRVTRFEEVAWSLPATLRLTAQGGERGRTAAGLAALAATWRANPGRVDLIALTAEGQLRAFEKQGPPARWIEVKLAGSKSNAQGVGTILEFKAGNFYNKVLATGSPIRVFTGNLEKLDVVRVTWPNQIIQNSIEVSTNHPIEVRESERLASSCPLLYVWDGKRYSFWTDILGVAPLGELAPIPSGRAPDGSRVKPYARDLVRLPEDLPAQDGNYIFQITDELREVDYLDQVRLIAVDHPAGEEIFANEIYSSEPPSPALYAVREKHFPVAATDDRGHDVLPLLREADGRYPTEFRRDRILGLAELHSLTLDLSNPCLRRQAALRDRPAALWLKGWVFWTDSNAARALMLTSSLKMVPPYLQVRDPKGEWVTVISDMGLPSGTNRTMRVDLTGKFLSKDRHVRILTNLCVYWDQIFFTTDERRLSRDGPAGPAHAGSPPRAVLPLVSADLHYRGFSTPASDPDHLKPDSFDYVRALGEAPWNPMQGRYTRYGPVRPLLARFDDRLVVMSTGDELTLEFDGRRLPAVKPGWKRSFFLEVSGWAKDGEPNTAFSRTVEPLPYRAMPNYPPPSEERAPKSVAYRRYLSHYETRPAWQLIPPLAPTVR